MNAVRLREEVQAGFGLFVGNGFVTKRIWTLAGPDLENISPR